MLETICDVMRDAYARNWITSRDGNCSVRHHDREHFYITPSAVRKQTLQPDQFKKIELVTTLNAVPPFIERNWKVAEYTKISANLEPSGELPLHFGLQQEIVEDTRVVLHLHPTYAIAAMHAGIELGDLVTNFPELGRYTRVAPTVGLVAPISQQLADHCHANLGLTSTGHISYDVVGITGHGVVAIATSPWRAMEHIERLEHICQIVLASGRY
jgi:ribulose-5-phosphate 4-epimerase/fuculose-1-phosphate aldolase